MFIIERFLSVADESENDITTEFDSVKFTETTTTGKIPQLDPVVEHIVYSAPTTDVSAAAVSTTTTTTPPPTAGARLTPKPTTASSSAKPVTPGGAAEFVAVAASAVHAPATIPPTLSSVQSAETTTTTTRTTTMPIGTATATTEKPPVEDEDYSFESMFSFLFNGDAAAEPQSPSSTSPPAVPANRQNTQVMAAETRIEHRADGEIDEKIHSDGVKPAAADAAADKNRHSSPENGHDKPHAHGLRKKPAVIKPTDSITDGHHRVYAESEPYAEAEVKTRFDVIETSQFSDYNNNKRVGGVAPSSSYHHHSHHSQTEVKSHFDVRDERPGADPDRESVPKIVQSTPDTADFKRQTATDNMKPKGPQSGLDENRAGVQLQQHGDHLDRQHQSQPAVAVAAIKVHNSNTKPLNTKAHSEFNPMLASLLKISGCNIYGRMYRVGKIIDELSNPCLECMCTEIGVHCNQLKC